MWFGELGVFFRGAIGGYDSRINEGQPFRWGQAWPYVKIQEGEDRDR